MLVCFLPTKAQGQKGSLPEKYIGYGWVVGFPYDNAFIPSNTPDKAPTVENYFVQKNKQGIRVNEDENAVFALSQGKFCQIKTRTGQRDSILVVPVMAYWVRKELHRNVELFCF